MADSNTSTSADPSLLQSLRLHLEGLQRTRHGQVLYNQIQRGLQQYGHEDGRIELVFVSFLHALLGKYATSPACDPATRVKARLIQQRLTLYLPATRPSPPARPAAAAPAAPRETRPVAPPAAVPEPSPVAPAPDLMKHARSAFGSDHTQSPLPQGGRGVGERAPSPPSSPSDRHGDSHLLPLSLRERAKGEGNIPHPRAPLPKGEGSEPSALARVAAEPPIPPAEAAPAPVIEAKPVPVPVSPPETVAPTDLSAPGALPVAETVAAEALPPARREHIEALEDRLAEKVTESIAVDKQFGELLESERENLKNLESPLGEFNDLKQILVKGLNELIEERQALIEKLSSAGDYLKAVEADRERLRQELSHARKHGLADELTGLPKREVFVKQLEAEIGRVKRYGFALAVAVIDVDNLESVNKRYGRPAGDAVLRCYAGTILAKFRTYDLVARYGGDEFAVLFPNTQKDGAMHALEKARKTAASTFIHQEGKNIPLPSFSSVLTQYAPGEPASALLQRADETLSQARLAGYNRMVVALPTA